MYQSPGLSLGLGLLKSEAKPEPTASPCQGPAGLGLERARLGGLRAWGPAQHITSQDGCMGQGKIEKAYFFYWSSYKQVEYMYL